MVLLIGLFFTLISPREMSLDQIDYTVVEELPERTQPRLLPRTGVTDNPAFRDSDEIHLVRDPRTGELAYTGEWRSRWNGGESGGVAVRPLDDLIEESEIQQTGFAHSVGGITPGTLKGKADIDHPTSRIQYPILVPDGKDDAFAMAPYMGYSGFPFPQPYFKGVLVYHRDGTIEDISPEEAASRPELVRTGRIYPEALARAEAEALAASGEIDGEISDAEGNKQPFLTSISPEQTVWLTVIDSKEPQGGAKALVLTDSSTGETEVWKPPADQPLISTEDVINKARALPLRWEEERCCDSEGASYTVKLRQVVEPRLAFRDGEPYYLVTVVPTDDLALGARGRVHTADRRQDRQGARPLRARERAEGGRAAAGVLHRAGRCRLIGSPTRRRRTRAPAFDGRVRRRVGSAVMAGRGFAGFAGALVAAACIAAPASAQDPVGDGDQVASLPELPVTTPQYAGYASTSQADCADVLCTGQSGLFYWLAARGADYRSQPTIVWSNGGPGASSMYGFFSENGPVHDHPRRAAAALSGLLVERRQLPGLRPPARHRALVPGRRRLRREPRPGHRASCGPRSATCSSGAGCRRARSTSSASPTAAPTCRCSPSRSSRRTSAAPDFDLGGVVIVAGWVDPLVQVGTIARYALTHGLIDDDQKQKLDKIYKRCQKAMDRPPPSTRKATQICESIQPKIAKMSGRYLTNIAETGDIDYQPIIDYLNRADVRAAIHARPEGLFELGSDQVAENYQVGEMDSQRGVVADLLDAGVPVMVVSGLNDGKDVNFLGARKWMSKMEWKGAEALRQGRAARSGGAMARCSATAAAAAA